MSRVLRWVCCIEPPGEKRERREWGDLTDVRVLHTGDNDVRANECGALADGRVLGTSDNDVRANEWSAVAHGPNAASNG
jgi:hypothetical protein